MSEAPATGLLRVRYQGTEPYILIPACAIEVAKQQAMTELERGTSEDYRVEEVPWNHAVGHRFRGSQWKPPFGTVVFRCTSYDSRQGFWMENEADPKDRHNVSERAIGRTFHRIGE